MKYYVFSVSKRYAFFQHKYIRLMSLHAITLDHHAEYRVIVLHLVINYNR